MDLINITGMDYAQILDYVTSRYWHEATIGEKMSAVEGAGDYWEKIAPIREQLDAFVAELKKKEGSDLSKIQIATRLSDAITRDD